MDGTPLDVMADFGEFFLQLLYLIGHAIDVISQTAGLIDSVNFEETIFTDYLGYAKYVMGDGLYTLFTSVLLIAIGVTVWTYLLKGIGYLKNVLPW